MESSIKKGLVPLSVGSKKGSATVLGCKNKVGALEEVVGEDDEFSHEGGEAQIPRETSTSIIIPPVISKPWDTITGIA